MPLYKTYVIENNLGKIYVGLTENTSRRLKQHQAGKCKSSAKLGNTKSFKLVHFWENSDFKLARKLEIYLQSLSVPQVWDCILDVPRFCSLLEKELESINLAGDWDITRISLRRIEERLGLQE